MEQTNSEANSGFPHKLTQTDRVKGGKTVTEKRKMVNALNPLKSGKYSKKLDFKFCNGCSYRRDCAFYQKDSACKIERSAIRGLVEMTGDASGLSLMRELMKGVQEMKVLTSALPIENRLPALNQLLQRMLELGKFRFGEKHFQNTQTFGSEIVVVGYGGAHAGGLDCYVSCLHCGARGKLLEVIEFNPEPEAATEESKDKFEVIDSLAIPEPKPADTVQESDNVSENVSVVEPEKKEKSRKQELQWPYGHRMPYL